MSRKINYITYYVKTGDNFYVYRHINKLYAMVKHLLANGKISFEAGIYDSSARIFRDELCGYDSISEGVYHYKILDTTYNILLDKDRAEYIDFVNNVYHKLRPIMLRYGR